MPMASESRTSNPRKRRFSGGATLGLEKHHDRAAAAMDRARLDEGEHLVAPHEQLADAALQHRLAAVRAQALAVDDANATHAHTLAAREEFGRRQGSLV